MKERPAKKSEYRTAAAYIVCGVFTTLLNLGLFRLLTASRVDYKLAEIVTLIAVKLVAYVLNKFFVFRSRNNSFSALCKEFLRYVIVRGGTMLIDFFGLILLVDVAGVSEMIGKYAITLLVVVLNYILGKNIVFVSRTATDKQDNSKTVLQPSGNYYRKHESTKLLEKRIMQSFFRQLDRVLQGVSANSVYEAGCGEGYFTQYLNSRFSPEEFIASDVSDQAIGEARNRNADVEFRQESIYSIDAADASFDIVAASEVLEHLETPAIAVAELFRISRRYVLLTVPNEPLWRFCNLLRGQYVHDYGNTPGHIQHYNKRQFSKLVEQNAGCTVKLVRSAFPLPWMQFLYEKRAIQ